MVNMKWLCVDFRTAVSRTLVLPGLFAAAWLVWLYRGLWVCVCCIVERKPSPDVYNVHEQVLSHISLREICTNEVALPAIITTLNH